MRKYERKNVDYIYGFYSLENGDGKERKEWRLPGLLYADDLVLCGESEENLRAMVGWFVEMYRRGLKLMHVRARWL